MVDAVNIVGIDGEALASALRSSPAWATERTLNEIKGLLAGSGSASKQKDVFSLAQRSVLKDLFSELEKESKAAKTRAEREKKVAEGRADRELLFGKGLTTLNQKILFVSAALNKMGDAIQDTFKSNINSFATLQSSGLDLMRGMDNASNGFQSLQQLSSLTGIRFTELSSTMIKYNSAINAFGVGKFAKTLGKSTDALTKFGFSSKETGDLLGAYLEIQRGHTDMQNKTTDETSAELVIFGKRINNLSLATGMARGAILANMDAMSKNTSMAILAAQQGSKSAEATTGFLASLKDQDLANTLAKMMTDPVKALNASFAALQKGGMGDLAAELETLLAGMEGLSESEKAKALANFAAAHDQDLRSKLLDANFQSQAPGMEAIGAANVKLITSLQAAGRQINKFAEESNDPAAIARADFAKSWENLMSQMQSTFSLPIKALELLTWGINGIAESIKWFTGLFSSETKGWIGAIGVVVGSLAGLVLGFKGVTLVLSLFKSSIPLLLRGSIGMIGTAIAAPFRIFSTGLTTASAALGRLSASASAASAATGAAGVAGKFGGLGKILGFLSAAAVVANIGDAAGGAMGVGKDKDGNDIELNKAQDDANWEMMSMPQKMMSGLLRGIEGVGGIIGMDNIARSAANDRIKAETAGLKTKKSTEISVPKDPAPSTIESPSAKPAKVTEKSAETAPDVSDPKTSTPAGLDTNAGSNDINNLLTFQSSVLQQILLSTQDVVSINRDILKFTRANA